MTKKLLSILLVVCMMASLFAGAAWADGTTYTVTCNTPTGGTVSANPASGIQKNGISTITVTPDKHYELSSLMVNGIEVKGSVSGNSYTISNITGDVTVNASFTNKVESIEVSTPPTTKTYYSGDSFDTTGMVVTANYAGGGTEQLGSTEYTCTPATLTNTGATDINTTVTITYKDKTSCTATTDVTVKPVQTYTISTKVYTDNVDSTTGGALEVNKTSVENGGVYTYTATANSGYSLIRVTVNDNGTSTDYTSTSKEITAHGNQSVYAYFSKNATTYTISSSASSGGSISPSGSTSVSSGGGQKYTAIANAGYTFNYFLIDGDKYDYTSTYTFSNVTANHSIVAYFTKDSTSTYSVSTSYSGQGNITTPSSYTSQSGNIYYFNGVSSTFKFTPSTNYIIDYVKIDGYTNYAAKSNGQYTFPSSSTGSHSVEVAFTYSAGTYSVNTYTYTNDRQSTTGGTLTTSRSQVDKGNTYSYTASAKSGYELNYVSVTNSGVTTYYTDYSNTITAKAGDQEVRAYFVPDDGYYSIYRQSYTDDSRGTTGGIVALSQLSVDNNKSYTYTVKTNDGYALDYVMVSNNGVETKYDSSTKVITASSGSQKVYAYFVSSSGDYRISATVYTSGNASTTGGSLTTSGSTASPSGTKNCYKGANVTYTITPNSGYYLSELLVDNSSAATNKLAAFTYTFSNVTANHTIKAYFLPTNTLKSIAVKTLPNKTSYVVGDTLNTSGLTLTATYNDGTSKIIASGFTCSPSTLSNAGTQAITASYDGKTTTFNVTVTAKSTTTYTDVASDKWYYSYVMDLSNRGIVTGNYNATTKTYYFRPEGNITRAEFVKILANASGESMTYNTSSFKDVGTSYWAYREIEWAYKNSIVNGTSDGKFSPAANITRQDMCVMLDRFAQHQKKSLTATTTAITFTDEASIASYAKAPVAEMQKAGIISGIASGSGYKFSPQGNAVRAEACTIISKYLAK